jgi:hypothetical protein
MTKAGKETLCGCLPASVSGLIFTLLRGNDHQSRIPDACGWRWGLVHAVCILHFGGRSQNTAMNSLDQAEFSGEYWSSANTAREETTLRQASVKLGGRGGGLRHGVRRSLADPTIQYRRHPSRCFFSRATL